MESEKMTNKEISTAKASLTRDIKSTEKEIAWITQDDNNGRQISYWYLGKPRAPQLRELRNDLKELKIKRAELDVLNYKDRLYTLLRKTYSVSDEFATQHIEEYKVFINSCALHGIGLKDTLIALYKISYYK